MSIITNKTEKVYSCEYDYHKNFFLLFHIAIGSTSDFLDYDLPYPSYLERINKGYLISWAIESGFNTNKNQAFLNDVIARFLITFADKQPKRLSYKPKFKDSKNAHVLERAYGLKAFSTKLKSLKNREFIPTRADSFEDLVFWAIKLFAEDLIRTYGLCSYSQIEDFAFTNFLDKKERSTLKAKAKSVFNYYEARDFKLSNQKKYDTLEKYWEESRMGRIENIKRVHEERRKSTKEIIENMLTGKHKEKYKKKNGKWNAAAISKDSKITDKTVRKYLKEIVI